MNLPNPRIHCRAPRPGHPRQLLICGVLVAAIARAAGGADAVSPSAKPVSTAPAAAPAKPAATAPAAAPVAAAPAKPAGGPKQAVYPVARPEMEKAAARDPLEFLRVALKWSDEKITDYTCLFRKQERIGGELRACESMQMKLRVDTFSVYVKWTGDQSRGQEVLYVQGRNDGNAIAHPSGVLGVLFRRVALDPAGKTALKYSRRPITAAGMANMLRLVIPQSELAKANGDLQLTFRGVREESGRPAYFFKRVLPNTNNYPCSVLGIYIDCEYLACLRTDAYDWDGRLVSQYIYSELSINPGLTDDDFDVDNREYNFRMF
jgi:hypothetical protein